MYTGNRIAGSNPAPSAKPTLGRAALFQFRQPFDETLFPGMALADRPEAMSEVLGLAFFIGNRPQVEEPAGGFVVTGRGAALERESQLAR